MHTKFNHRTAIHRVTDSVPEVWESQAHPSEVRTTELRLGTRGRVRDMQEADGGFPRYATNSVGSRQQPPVTARCCTVGNH